MGLAELKKFLDTHHKNEKILFMITWMQDKKITDALLFFEKLDITWQPVILDNDREEKFIKKSLEEIFGAKLVLKSKRLEELFQQLYQLLSKYDLIVIAGSIYLIGGFLKKWQQNK